jgi:hypothetical protein
VDSILHGLMELVGVRATMVLDPAGQIVAWRGHAAFDRSLCERVGGVVTKAIESVHLQDAGWETISAQFANGRILVRRVSPSDGPGHVLAVVADPSLNPSFATVALRVAASKVRTAAEGGAPPPAAGAQPGVFRASAGGEAADPASAEFLARCVKELARHVGPISKVYVQEAVSRVSPGAPFSLAAARLLVEDLSGQIEDAADRAQFRKGVLEKR